MILIVAGAEGLHIRRVAEELRKRGEEPAFLYRNGAGLSTAICYDGEPEGQRTLRMRRWNRATEVNPAEVRSVWRRNFLLSADPREPLYDVNVYACEQYVDYVDPLHGLLPHARWVNPPPKHAASRFKIDQLTVAQRLGLRIPRTIVSDRIDEVISFFAEHGLTDGDFVANKALGVSGFDRYDAKEEEWVSFVRGTERTTLSELKRRAEHSHRCPSIFQEYIEKDFELRVTMVGNHALSCAIYSQQSNDERVHIDWRYAHESSGGIDSIEHRAFALPSDIEARCRALMNHFGIVLGGIDMIVTPSGDYVFLEVNPDPQWLWMEQLAGLPIGKTLARVLSQ